jgi:hypothetical protein
MAALGANGARVIKVIQRRRIKLEGAADLRCIASIGRGMPQPVSPFVCAIGCTRLIGA